MFKTCKGCEFKFVTRAFLGLCPKCFVTRGYHKNKYRSWDKDTQLLYTKEVKRAREINPQAWKLPWGLS